MIKPQWRNRYSNDDRFIGRFKEFDLWAAHENGGKRKALGIQLIWGERSSEQFYYNIAEAKINGIIDAPNKAAFEYALELLRPDPSISPNVRLAMEEEDEEVDPVPF